MHLRRRALVTRLYTLTAADSEHFINKRLIRVQIPACQCFPFRRVNAPDPDNLLVPLPAFGMIDDAAAGASRCL
jgi:hypothetical protein